MNLPNIHVLHTHNNIVVLAQECTVKVHDVVGITFVHDVQLADNPASGLLLCFHMYNLFLVRAEHCAFSGILLPFWP